MYSLSLSQKHTHTHRCTWSPKPLPKFSRIFMYSCCANLHVTECAKPISSWNMSLNSVTLWLLDSIGCSILHHCWQNDISVCKKKFPAWKCLEKPDMMHCNRKLQWYVYNLKFWIGTSCCGLVRCAFFGFSS